jgi:hypothetical protein
MSRSTSPAAAGHVAEQPAEAGLAVRGAIVFDARQRQADARLQPLRHAREQKSRLMARRQLIELPRGPMLLDEGQLAVRVLPQSRTMVEYSDEAGEASDAIAARVAHLDDVALKP